MSKTTAAQVNKAIRATGLKLVQGRGYTYVSGPGSERWPHTETGYTHVSALTVAQWVKTINEMIKENS